MTKTFVIADIHGCEQALEKLLDKIKSAFEKEDKIIFLGDYIDRGPASRQVVEKIISLKRQSPHILTLMGNHEQMLLDFLAGQNQDAYLQYGGLQTLQNYNWEAGTRDYHIPTTHIHFFKELLPYWEDDNYIYVHAGLQPGVHLSRQNTNWLLWSRDTDNNKETDRGKTIIYGHTTHTKPLITPYKIGIDTGAVYGGKLTCLILPDLEFVSVASERFWLLRDHQEAVRE